MSSDDSEYDSDDSFDARQRYRETNLDKAIVMFRTGYRALCYQWSLIALDPRKWYRWWASRSDYMSTDVVVIIRRACKAEDFNEVYNITKETWRCISSIFGHKTTEIYFTKRGQWTDRSNAAKHRVRKCNRILLVSKWDSKWQWDSFVKNSVEFSTEVEQLDSYLVEPQELLVQRELAREPVLRKFIRKVEAGTVKEDDIMGGRKVRPPIRMTTIVRYTCYVFLAIIFCLILGMLYYSSQATTLEMYYKERMSLDYESVANKMYTPTWYEDHWYNYWDESKHRSPGALEARPLSAAPVVMKPVEFTELENLIAQVEAAKAMLSAGGRRERRELKDAEGGETLM